MGAGREYIWWRGTVLGLGRDAVELVEGSSVGKLATATPLLAAGMFDVVFEISAIVFVLHVGLESRNIKSV
jgi:hypothetical protein